jgi:hypothetical protein
MEVARVSTLLIQLSTITCAMTCLRVFPSGTFSASNFVGSACFLEWRYRGKDLLKGGVLTHLRRQPERPEIEQMVHINHTRYSLLIPLQNH